MRVKNRLLTNYILIFIITSAIAVIAFLFLGIASDNLEDSLVKNKYTADSLMQDDISKIEFSEVIKHNGGIQVINSEYKIVFTKGINNFLKGNLSASEFTEFLTNSQSTNRKYNYSIAYNENEKFWLIVTFPTSIRIDFNIAYNSFYQSSDTNMVRWYIVIIILIYISMLSISTLIYSRLTAVSFTKPLSALQGYANKLRNGDYSARLTLNLDNEFEDLAHSYNEVANKIQKEIDLRKKSEDIRRQLTLDIAHDLKNPLAVIMGYAEYCLNNPNKENDKYLKLIYHNSSRANCLIKELFDLSKLESPEYKLNMKKTDVTEYLRTRLAHFIETIESAEFTYEFEIPEKELYVNIDEKEMDKVINNLFENAIRYNNKGTKISLILNEADNDVKIIISDDGKGISKELTEKIFEPFVRTDEVRNSETGGSGLGLAIAKKIIQLHGGNISLVTDINEGCTFIIQLPIAN